MVSDSLKLMNRYNVQRCSLFCRKMLENKRHGPGVSGSLCVSKGAAAVGSLSSFACLDLRKDRDAWGLPQGHRSCRRRCRAPPQLLPARLRCALAGGLQAGHCFRRM